MKGISEVYAYKSALNESDDFVKDMMKPLSPYELYVSTDELNKILGKMVLLKPEQWIWSHNRWK